MNTENGALEFEGTLDNSQLDKAIEQSAKKIQGFTDKVQSSGRSIEEMANATKENVQIQKKVIKDLEAQWAELNKQIGKLPPGSAQAELIRQANAVKQEIEGEKSALVELEQALKNNDDKTASFRARITQLTNELANMERNGQKNTEAFREMQQELAALTDQMGDTRRQAHVLSSDTAQLDGIINGLSGVAGGFSAVQGAIGLVSGESKNLQKIMLKVQSLMSITMGLQQLSNTLNKDSAFMLVTVNKAKEWWNRVTTQAIAVQTAETTAATAGTAANWSLAAAFRAVGIAIKSIPVFGWVIAGISAIATAVALFTKKNKENTDSLKEQEKQLSVNERVIKAVGDSTQSEKTKVEILSSILHDNTQELKNRQQALEQLKRIVPDYNAMLDREGNLTRENTKAIDEYIDALNRIAMAKAVQSELEKINAKELSSTLAQTKATNDLAEAEKKLAEEHQKAEVKRQQVIEQSTGEDFALAARVRAAGAGEREAADKVDDVKKQQEQIQKDLDAIKKDREAINKYIKDNDLSGSLLDSNTEKKDSGKSKSPKDAYKEQLDEIKGLYTEYNKWRNSTDQQVREAAQTEFAGLVAQGVTFLDYLNNQRDKLLAAGTNTEEVQAKLKQLNDAIADATKESVLSQFTESLRAQLSAADSVLDKLDVIAEKRKELSGDGSELDQAEQSVLDNAEEDARTKLAEQQKALLEEYASYNDKRLQMEKEYTANLQLLEAARDSATTEEERRRSQAAIENYQREMTKALQSSGDPEYDSLLASYTDFEKKKSEIAADFDEKRRIARLHNNEELVEELNKQEKTALTKNAFDALKANPDYVRAFDDLKVVSDDTLKSLLERFDEVKEAAARDLDPADFKEYMSRIQDIVDEMNSRDPFAGLIAAYTELRKSAENLKRAEENLKKAEKTSGKQSQQYAEAEKQLKAAQDQHAKATKAVANAEKETKAQVKDLCDALGDLGDAVGGEAGNIISLIGDIGSFVMNTIDSFKMVVGATATAISTMEKASVILTVISVAVQLAQKIASLFEAQSTEAKYQKAKKSYDEYIDVLDDVIAKQKELMETLSGEEAVHSFNNAKKLLEDQEEAARKLGEQYLRAGGKAGFLGFGFSASHGVKNYNKITQEGWKELLALQEQGILSLREYTSIENGDLTQLFKLSADQIKKIMTEAPQFWASLDEEVRSYLEQIIKCSESTDDLVASMNEALTGVSFDSVADDFESLMEDMDASAKDFSKSMTEYMRKALINQLFKSQYKAQLERWYNMWAEAINPDGEGGAVITEEEQRALDNLRNSIVDGASAAAKQINDQFKTPEDADTATGSIQNVTEETAGKIEGQMQAIRINQMEALEHMRSTLQYLAVISSNTGYLVNLRKLDTIIAKLDSNSDTMRGQGLV